MLAVFQEMQKNRIIDMVLEPRSWSPRANVVPRRRHCEQHPITAAEDARKEDTKETAKFQHFDLGQPLRRERS